MKNILITGGAGFIGSHVADKLLADEIGQIFVVDNFNNFYDPKIKHNNVDIHLTNPRYKIFEVSIEDRNRLDQIFSATKFDAIIHLAASAGVRPSLEKPFDYEKTNVTGTLNLLELARHYRIPKFIFGSSSSVYGVGATSPFHEEAPIYPISPYAATKAAGEMFVHTYSHLYGLPCICLRFFTVYGPRQRPDLAIHKFVTLMTSQKPIPLYGDGSTERDYTYVDDIVDGIIAALNYENSQFEIINLGGSQTISLIELVKLIEKNLGITAQIEWLPMHPGDLKRTHASIEKARRLLNWSPQIGIETGIRKFVDWYLESRPE